MVPLCDLRAQYESLKHEIDAAMQTVAAGGQFILGSNVKAFEEEMAAYLGCKHAIGVGSGTDALHLAVRALDIGPGDEVITTPFTFIATSEAICLVGATPVFVDIDPRTFNIDPNLIESVITPRTKAILPVHLYGQPCDMDAIMEIAARHGLRVVEDCAQALGAEYRGRKAGTFGDAGCLSFFPSKNLGCFGDGGMVVTNDGGLSERLEYLRRHGGRVKYHHEEIGLNSRLDELQAAILRVKLPHLDHWNSLRRQHAHRYNSLLTHIKQVVRPAELVGVATVAPFADETPPVGDCPDFRGGLAERKWDCPLHARNPILRAVYHQYTIRVDDRDAVAADLRDEGTGCFPYYPVPLHLQRVHEGLGNRQGSLPCAEKAASECLSLPMFPELNCDQIEQVVDSVRLSLQPGVTCGAKKSA